LEYKATLLSDMKMWPEAVGAYEKLIEQGMVSLELWHAYINCVLMANDNEYTDLALQVAIEAHPHDGYLNFRAACHYFSRELWALGLPHLHRAMQVSPSYATKLQEHYPYFANHHLVQSILLSVE
jgi:hypothetical protein